MKNIIFLKMQTDKVLEDMRRFQDKNVEGTAIVGAIDTPPILNREVSLIFNGFKFSVLELIKEKSEEELASMLPTEISKMCKDCQEGFKTFDIKCHADLNQFVLCEYIKRSLM